MSVVGKFDRTNGKLEAFKMGSGSEVFLSDAGSASVD